MSAYLGTGGGFQRDGIQSGCLCGSSFHVHPHKGCSAILLGHDRQHCRFNPSPPLQTCSLSRRRDESACRCPSGGRRLAEAEEPPGPGSGSVPPGRSAGLVLFQSLFEAGEKGGGKHLPCKIPELPRKGWRSPGRVWLPHLVNDARSSCRRAPRSSPGLALSREWTHSS